MVIPPYPETVCYSEYAQRSRCAASESEAVAVIQFNSDFAVFEDLPNGRDDRMQIDCVLVVDSTGASHSNGTT